MAEQGDGKPNGNGRARNMLEQYLPVRIVAVMVCILVSGFYEGSRVVTSITSNWQHQVDGLSDLARIVAALNREIDTKSAARDAQLVSLRADEEARINGVKADQDELRSEVNTLSAADSKNHDDTTKRLEQIELQDGNVDRELSTLNCHVLHEGF